MDKGYMDMAEYHARESALFSFETLNQARARAHSLLLLLLAGGAGLGTLGLAQWPGQTLLAVVALTCSAWWFVLAAMVAWRGLTSVPMRSWATPGLFKKWPQWQAWALKEKEEAIARGENVSEQTPEWLDAKARCAVYERTLENMDKAAELARAASTMAWRANNLALKGAAAGTPLVALLATVALDYFLGALSLGVG